MLETPTTLWCTYDKIPQTADSSLSQELHHERDAGNEDNGLPRWSTIRYIDRSQQFLEVLLVDPALDEIVHSRKHTPQKVFSASFNNSLSNRLFPILNPI